MSQYRKQKLFQEKCATTLLTKCLPYFLTVYFISSKASVYYVWHFLILSTNNLNRKQHAKNALSRAAMYSLVFLACFSSSLIIMKENTSMSPKTKNKKSIVCLILFLFVCLFAGVQPPLAKPLVHDFVEQSKNVLFRKWSLCFYYGPIVFNSTDVFTYQSFYKELSSKLWISLWCENYAPCKIVNVVFCFCFLSKGVKQYSLRCG